MAGTLSVQKIQGLATSANPTTVEIASGHVLQAPGHVLQVLQSTTTDVTTISNATFVEILSQAITPSSSSSKILVEGSVNVGGANNAYGWGSLFRGDTEIGIGTTATGNQTNASFFCMSGLNSNHDYRSSLMTFKFLDSPNTTSATTYKLKCATGSSNIYINRAENTSNSNIIVRTMSTLTVMEIAG